MDNMPTVNGTYNKMMPMMMPMQMSFYWGKDATVLFSGWPKHSVGMYISALIFVFCMALFSEIFANQPPIKRGTSPFVGGFLQACVYLVRIGLNYLVMLSVMSFNGGIFLAAVIGHSLGFFIHKIHALGIANREDKRSSSTDNI